VSVVNPIPIEGLTLSPNPANGTKSEKVTGTVELQRPVPSPITATVRIFAIGKNAFLREPISGVQDGTQTTVQIGPGESKGTFTVSTDDDDIPKGESRTTRIVAFYTVDTDPVQLKVQKP
jgi:hypothetical protein